jgi:hypothetical protein
LAPSLLRPTTSNFIFELNSCGHSPYVTSSLTRGRVCRLHLLLAFAIAVILRPECRGTHGHILLSQIRDSHNMEGQVPVFISPRNRVAQLYAQALGPFSSSPTTRRVTVEVFDPASTLVTDSTELLVFVIQPRHRPHRERIIHYCLFYSFRRNNVSTELFPSNGCCRVFTQLLLGNGSTCHNILKN